MTVAQQAKQIWIENELDNYLMVHHDRIFNGRREESTGTTTSTVDWDGWEFTLNGLVVSFVNPDGVSGKFKLSPSV